MNVIGVAYSLVILETTYHFHEFRRTDDDYVAMGNTYNLLGRFTDALKMVEKSKTRTTASLACRAVAYLGVNQFDGAWSYAQQALQSEDQNDAPDRVLLGLQFLMVAYSLSFSVGTTLMSRGIFLNLPDFIIAHLVFSFTTVEQVREDELNQLPTTVLSDKEVAARYPLTHATLLVALGERNEGISILDTVHPKSLEEEIYKMFLTIMIKVTDPSTTPDEDKKQFDSWSKENLPKFSQLAEGKAATTYGPVVIGILESVYGFATRLESQYQQSWLYIVNELAKIITADPSWKLSPQGMERMLGSVRVSLGYNRGGV